MDDVYKLEKLQLIKRLTQEISNHTDVNDSTVAEFVIAIHEKSKTKEKFVKSLNDNGAEFPRALVDSLDRLILTMHPKYKRKSVNKTRDNATARNDVEKKIRTIPALSLPDQEWKSSEPTSKEKDTPEKEVGDVFSQVEGIGGPPAEKQTRDASPLHRDYGHGRGRPQDERPVMYKIYDGKVTNIKDFGAFVALEGVAGRVEGMVHVSSIQQGGRINFVGDLLSRGQPVKVKVVSVAGTRISLSIKDVDQTTGRDLTPYLHIKSDAEMNNDTRMAPEHLSSSSALRIGSEDLVDKPIQSAKRLTPPERWGAVCASEYPELDEDFCNLHITAEAEEEVDVEVREHEPSFLKGHTKQTFIFSPVHLVKETNGYLNRAALTGSYLANERRKLRQRGVNHESDSHTRDFGIPSPNAMSHSLKEKVTEDVQDAIMSQMAGETSAWKDATFYKATTFGKITSLSTKAQREGLPIFKLREPLLEAIRDYQILIVIGATTSGKSTQMTQYLVDAGYADRGMVGCTQPRSIAAMSMAEWVAEEVNCQLGQDVGYTIRFEDCTSSETRVKYMTDDVLQRECLLDPNVTAYQTIILNEAHERTIPTDVLFGLLKRAIKCRPDLKLIVTSATFEDAEKFSKYFYGCPIFTIPGQTYPVELLYTKEPESDYLEASLITTMQIHLSEPPGNILVFLTDYEEIHTFCEILSERMKSLGPQVPQLIILSPYSNLPSGRQSKIFEPVPPGARKVLIAINITETSFTFDSISYVVDPGFVKQKACDVRLGMDQLVVTPVSQAQAKQRAGRAGHTGPGKCYRLYTEDAFRNEMMPSSIPEIQRQDLSHTVLMLKAMGVNDFLNFDFMDPPPPQALLCALESLYALSALDDGGFLTPLGRKMADFHMDPPLAKMLIASVNFGCSEEILSIAAMLSVENVFYRPKENQAQSDSKKANFHQPKGDHFTLLAVYNGWRASNFSDLWCYENFIQVRQLRRARDVRNHLLRIMNRYKHVIISAGRDYSRVQLAILSGYFRHVAKKDPQEGYRALVEGTPVHIHPSSALFGRPPEWLVYNKLLLTTREYCHTVTAIEPKWLAEVAPQLFRLVETRKVSNRKRGENTEPLYNKYENPDQWRVSKVKRSAKSSQTFG